MGPTITTLRNTFEIASYIAHKLDKKLDAKKSTINIAISGGNTPKEIFKHWSSHFKNEINWRNISFYWVDERCVPSSSSESNYGEAKRLFFDKVLTTQDNVFPIVGDNKPHEEVFILNSLVQSKLPQKNNLPVFDLILLGMGTDGHTASIFPGQLELFNLDEAYTTSVNPHTGQKRITLTGKTINNANEVCFIITGSDKKLIIDEIINKKGNWQSYPASFIINDNLEWIIEEIQ
ncbi:MAG TPA: 6-phosphogluconolactonase [Bacteroidales bacterium]|nr:6-phosphogluconolactonase [Bacteroidales bacterium]